MDPYPYMPDKVHNNKNTPNTKMIGKLKLESAQHSQPQRRYLRGEKKRKRGMVSNIQICYSVSGNNIGSKRVINKKNK